MKIMNKELKYTEARGQTCVVRYEPDAKSLKSQYSFIKILIQTF